MLNSKVLELPGTRKRSWFTIAQGRETRSGPPIDSGAEAVVSAKNGEWCARRDSNSRPDAPEDAKNEESTTYKKCDK
jgi:hypothetical protein